MHLEIVAGASSGRPVERVVRQLLERVAVRGELRVETVPARWPLTRHRLRTMAQRLVEQGLLHRVPTGAVCLTAAGRALLRVETAWGVTDRLRPAPSPGSCPHHGHGDRGDGGRGRRQDDGGASARG